MVSNGAHHQQYQWQVLSYRCNRQLTYIVTRKSCHEVEQQAAKSQTHSRHSAATDCTALKGSKKVETVSGVP